MKKTAVKFLSFIFAVALAVVGFYCNAESFGTVKLFYETESVNETETVNMPVKITDCKGIISLILSLDYNSECLELVGVENGDFFERAPLKSENFAVKPYKIYWENSLSGNVEGRGTLCVLKFLKKSNGNHNLKLRVEECFDKNYNNVSLNTLVTTEQAETLKQQNLNNNNLETVTAKKDKKGNITVTVPENAKGVTVYEQAADGSKNGTFIKTNGKEKITVKVDGTAEKITVETEKHQTFKTEKNNYKTVIIITSVGLTVLIAAAIVFKIKLVKK